MEQRPLSLPEFIGPLSLCANTMDDQYDEFKVRINKIVNRFRNSPTTFQEMESVVLKSKRRSAVKMVTQTLRRRKRRAKRESDYKCQKDSAIRYTNSRSASVSFAGRSPCCATRHRLLFFAWRLEQQTGLIRGLPSSVARTLFLIVWRVADVGEPERNVEGLPAECLVMYLNPQQAIAPFLIAY